MVTNAAIDIVTMLLERRCFTWPMYLLCIINATVDPAAVAPGARVPTLVLPYFSLAWRLGNSTLFILLCSLVRFTYG